MMLVYYQRKKIPQASNFNLIDIALLFLYIAFVVVIVWQLDLLLLVQSVPITTKDVSSNPTHFKVYSIQLYMIKFVSDLQQISGFLQVFWFPLPMKTDSHYITEILVKVALSTITLTLIKRFWSKKINKLVDIIIDKDLYSVQTNTYHCFFCFCFFFKYFRQEIHQYAQEYVYASFIQQVYTEE